MEYSHATVGQMQLDDYVAAVPNIYSTHDQNRSIWDVWSHTLHHAASVAEMIRKGAPSDNLFKEIADFSLWLFTTVQKLSGRFGEQKSPNETPADTFIRIESGCSDLVWHKYPRVCPSCFARTTEGDPSGKQSQEYLQPCDCLLHDADPQDENSTRQALAGVRSLSEDSCGDKPKNIDEWQEMFGTVFASNLRHLSLKDVALHLMEELGEASDAMIRMYSYVQKTFVAGEPNRRQLKLETQLADVFSWLFSLVEKLNRLEDEQRTSSAASVTAGPIRLSQIIWGRYGSDSLRSFYCPHCKDAVCSCPIILVPPTRPVEELKKLFQ
jgi:NTP pyrophosphatase (non-canonical NTP hydrolase)